MTAPDRLEYPELAEYYSRMGRAACVTLLLLGLWWGMAIRTTPEAVEIWLPPGPDGSYAHYLAWLAGRGPGA